jgi:photosystem II stability/assembly factor-like uncharacterized protein
MADRLHVSTKKGLFTFEKNGAGWKLARASFLGENVSLTLTDARDNGLYAALNLGHFGCKLKYSPDGGQTWEERGVPEFPEGGTFSTWDGKPPQQAKMKGFWALECQGGDKAGTLWTGTAPGGLFRSADGGQTWQLVQGLWDRPEREKWFGGGTDLPALHSVIVDPRDPKKVKVAVSCGGVWQTADGGQTWEVTCKGMKADYLPPERADDPNGQDPHMMVQCQSNPERVWVQHHCGIFRSDDGAKTWEPIKDVKPSVFGFGVAVHPKDGQTAWFVPAIKDERRIPVDGKLVVTRTRDAGKTFDVLTKGLPQENAYDLVYRHALVVDETGNRLAIGSTTGGAWTSDDQGDHWTPLPARLPPVHAVRFA